MCSGVATYIRLSVATGIVLFSLIDLIAPRHASAVQWSPLARTGRHDVAIEMESVRINSLGRLGVWLRFTPHGEEHRKKAAAEYGQKTYQLHLEYYEIDCGEHTALLGVVDVLGPARKRLARMKGNKSLDAIAPGSVLDMAALKACPAVEEETTDAGDTPEPPDTSAAPSTARSADEKPLSEELKQSINEALQATATDPSSLDAWRDLGNAYFDADMPEKAIAAYGRALAIKPDNTDILNDQGAMYRQIGDFARALTNFQIAGEVDPGNLESIYNSGYVLAFDLNQIEKALTVWKAYLKLDNSSETARQVQSFIDRYGK